MLVVPLEKTKFAQIIALSKRMFSQMPVNCKVLHCLFFPLARPCTVPHRAIFTSKDFAGLAARAAATQQQRTRKLSSATKKENPKTDR